MTQREDLQSIIERTADFFSNFAQNAERISKANTSNTFFSPSESKDSGILKAVRTAKEEVDSLSDALSGNEKSHNYQAQSTVEETLQTIQNEIYSSI